MCCDDLRGNNSGTGAGGYPAVAAGLGITPEQVKRDFEAVNYDLMDAKAYVVGGVYTEDAAVPYEELVRKYHGIDYQSVLTPEQLVTLKGRQPMHLTEQGAAVQWATEAPSTPGWYWCKNGQGLVTIYSVVDIRGTLFIAAGHFFGELRLLERAQWAGPIEPPAEPYEERETNP